MLGKLNQIMDSQDRSAEVEAESFRFDFRIAMALRILPPTNPVSSRQL